MPDRELWLSAFTRRSDLEKYLQNYATTDQAKLVPDIVRHWEHQQDRLRALEVRDGGVATATTIEGIPAKHTPLLDAYAAEEAFKQAFPEQGWAYGLVRLDNLVPLRKHVNLGYVDQLAGSYPASPSLEHLIQICLSPTKHPEPLVHVESSPNVYEFQSPRSNLRFLGSVVRPAKPDDLRVRSTGLPVVAVVAFVGFDTPTVSAMRIGSRLALVNGLHRAYALRSIGLGKIPVLIRGDHGGAGMPSDQFEFSVDDVSAMLRPPLLRDFFDPGLSMTFLIKTQLKAVNVGFEIKQRSILS
jgi:hypothetical protein